MMKRILAVMMAFVMIFSCIPAFANAEEAANAGGTTYYALEGVVNYSGAVVTWLKDNAWKFGFILRFPADKTDITTIQFEPWHYRYVGRYHAQKIHASGLCLEEYVAQLGN